jgi:hypothetical protein
MLRPASTSSFMSTSASEKMLRSLLGGSSWKIDEAKIEDQDAKELD